LEKLTEIRWHGRAGQGIVTASELLAESALKEDKYFQSFPDYGPERMGAPIRAYTRISTRPIDVHYQILQPEVVVVVNPNLLGVENVAEGLVEKGIVVVNSPETPQQVRSRLGLKGNGAKVFTVDATQIAMETLKRDIPATLMLGAIVRATGLVDLEHVIETVLEKLGEKLRGEVVEANVKALRRAYEEVKEG
jgi:pyruvate ferredoxin oxidoreductase gamma subunit